MSKIRLAVFIPVALPLIVMAAMAAMADETWEVPLGHASRVRFSAVPAEIVVGNPAIADITVQSGKSIVVFGKHAGGTSLFALDGQGNLIWERTVVVTSSSADGVGVHYGTGKNWSPGGTSIAVACTSQRCSDPVAVTGDAAAKTQVK